MIQTTISGRLGKPAEVRQAGNTQVINFTVAVDVGFGDKKHTLWVEVARFGDNTKIAEYLQKGTQVLVIGESDIRTWESNGKSGATMTLKADKIELLGGKSEGQQQAPQSEITQSYKPQVMPIGVDDSDLPF